MYALKPCIKYVIFLAFLSHSLPSGAQAEIKRCPDGTFTSRADAPSECKAIATQRVCGSDGNRYFAPASDTSQSADSQGPCQELKDRHGEGLFAPTKMKYGDKLQEIVARNKAWQDRPLQNSHSANLHSANSNNKDSTQTDGSTGRSDFASFCPNGKCPEVKELLEQGMCAFSWATSNSACKKLDLPGQSGFLDYFNQSVNN